MSKENGKVCCNCRHNIRTGEPGEVKCHCEVTGDWLSYLRVMEYWCRHWAKTKEEENG